MAADSDLHVSSRRVGAAVALLAATAACVRREPAPAPPTPSPAPVPDTAAVAAPDARRGSVAYAPGTYQYRVTSDASVELLPDSSGARPARPLPNGGTLVDTVTTAVFLTYQIAAGDAAQDVAGSVDSFTVRSTGLVRPAPRPLAAPLTFRATLSGGRDPVSFTATPDTACAAPDAALLALARDLLVPLPLSLAPGSEWRDTVTTTVCRAGIPVTTQGVHSYRVEGGAARNGVAAVRLTRTTAIALQGQGTVREQTVVVTGTGAGRGELFFDTAGGRYLGAQDDSEVALSVTNGTQTRRFVQRARQAAELLAP